MSIIPQIILNSLIAGSIYSLVALGFNLIYGTTKFFNLSHGAVAVIGGYVAFYFTKSLGFGIIISAILGIFAAGFLGYFLDRFVFRKLRQKKASNMVFLISSLGLMIALQAVTALLFTSNFQIFSSQFTSYQIFGGVITQVEVIIFISAALISVGLFLLLKKTRWGRTVRAISDDEEVSKIVGIDTNKVISQVFFIGSAIAGLSGVLSGLDIGLEPTMGLLLLFKGVIAAVIGGVGNVYGGVLGAFLLAFVENFGIWGVSAEWKDVISFGLLIIFLLFRPQGILKK